MKTRIATLATIFFLALLSYGFTRILFHPLVQEKERELQEKKEALREIEQLVSQKASYASQWENKKALLPISQTPEEALNLWVKELLSHAQSEGITFTRLEPQGVKEKGKGKALRLFLTFQGDIRKLIHLLYYLNEKDPLSRIESYSMKEEEGTKTFTYELTLERALL